MSHVSPPNLGSIITASGIRKAIYGIYGILIIVIGAVQVAFAAVPAWGGQPDWLTAALAVGAYLGVPIAGLALANTPPAGTPESGTPPPFPANLASDSHAQPPLI